MFPDHFCPFLVILGEFWGPKSKKNFKIFFSGIDSEWSETHFKPKISRKKFSSSLKIFEMAGTFLPFYARPAAPSPPGGASAASILEDSRGSWLRHLQGLELQNEGFRNFWRRGSESRNFFSRK